MTSSEIRARLLEWYDRQARILPWRTPPDERARGVRPDPYRVWLSEIMLQQTTIPHASAYFLEFIRRWPTVGDLATAEDGEVMAAWAGLGYYARARNLLSCARTVAVEYGGRFPQTEAELLSLPGVGPYTAAAIAAIAFDEPSNVVDGNVERVMARLHALEALLPGAKAELKTLAGQLVTDQRPGDWAQALMDLGAVVCRPKSPLCDRCPIAGPCLARMQGDPAHYPRKSTKAERPHRHGAAIVLTRGLEVALVRRPPKGLLGGMLALPTTDWGPTRTNEADLQALAPEGRNWRSLGEIEHTFTHFSLTLQVWRGEAAGGDYIWMDAQAAGQALPSVFLKALRAGLGRVI